MSVPWKCIEFPAGRPRPQVHVGRRRVVGVYAIDCPNNALVLGDSERQVCTVSSFVEAFRWLTRPVLKGAVLFTWDVDALVSAVCRWLPEWHLALHARTGKLTYGGLRALWGRGKFWSLGRRDVRAWWCGLSSWYKLDLDSALWHVLGREPVDFGLDSRRLRDDYAYYAGHLADVRRLAGARARDVAMLGRQVEQAVRHHFPAVPKHLISPASAVKAALGTLPWLPSYDKTPRHVQHYAYESLAAGRFEQHLVGHSPWAWCYDIKSCFPHWKASVPRLERGKWYYVDEPSGDALLGFYKVRVHVPLQDVCPLPLRVRKCALSFPAGEWDTFVSLDDYEVARGSADFDWQGGWEYHDASPVYPYRELMEKLYRLKQGAKSDPVAYDIYKTASCAAYGVTLSTIPTLTGVKGTRYWSPVEAAVILSRARRQVLEAARLAGERLVCIASDSVTTTKELELDFGEELGQWALQNEGRCAYVCPGIGTHEGEVKHRGTKQLVDLYDLAERNPDGQYVELWERRPYTVWEALTREPFAGFGRVGEIVDDTYRLWVNPETNRTALGKFEDWKDLTSRSIPTRPHFWAPSWPVD